MHLGRPRQESHAGFASIYSRNTVRWRERRFVVVDYAGMEAIITRELGKRRLRHIPIKETVVHFTPGDGGAWSPDLVSMKEAWQQP
jgi:hypothetical protein